MLKEKSSPKWLFGLGYIFVASIILMNYISQKTESRGANPLSDRGQVAVQREPTDQDLLKKQLDEERRINREMSEMISNLQTAIKYGGAGFDYSSDGASGSAALPGEYTFEEILEKGLPDLIQVSLPSKGGMQNTSSKRNPFLPFYEASKKDSQATKAALPELPPQSVFRLKTHPKIPLPLQNTWNAPIIFESPSQNGMN